jgi:iron-sulfur cluster repair protein YtfE (RIC family)
MADGTNWLHHDHRRYESVLDDCRVAAEQEDWKRVRRLFDELVSHLKLHMRMEERVVYPAYDEAQGADRAVTEAMRGEHDEVVRLLRDLSWILKTNDSEHFLESLQPLKEAMARHHHNEEQTFLPVAAHALLGRREEITRKLEAFGEEQGERSWDF